MARDEPKRHLDSLGGVEWSPSDLQDSGCLNESEVTFHPMC